MRKAPTRLPTPIPTGADSTSAEQARLEPGASKPLFQTRELLSGGCLQGSLRCSAPTSGGLCHPRALSAREEAAPPPPTEPPSNPSPFLRLQCVVYGMPSKLGYASLYENLLTVLRGLLPKNEAILHDLREEMPMYPAIALREIVANAPVHQDFAVRGSGGPMIEIFSDRLVVRNPGNPLVAPDRFLNQDRARNEKMVDLMRRMKICERSGSGVDKALEAVESMQPPAPEFRIDRHEDLSVGETVVTLFAPKDYSKMNIDERVKAAYWHAAFLFIPNERMSNSSLRARFGLDEGASSGVSLVIKRAISDRRIKVEDPNVGSKAMRYVPWWA